jgi:hypothetical protein
LPVCNLLIVENGRRLTAPNEVDPDGRAVALVTVRDVCDWSNEMASAACSRWEPGWLAWILEDVRAIRDPFPLVAARKLYDVEVDDSLAVQMLPKNSCS